MNQVQPKNPVKCPRCGQTGEVRTHCKVCGRFLPFGNSPRIVVADVDFINAIASTIDFPTRKGSALAGAILPRKIARQITGVTF